MPAKRVSRIEPAAPNATDRLLTIPQFGEITGVSTRKTNQLLASGVIPRIKIGRCTRIRLSDAMWVVENGVA